MKIPKEKEEIEMIFKDTFTEFSEKETVSVSEKKAMKKV